MSSDTIQAQYEQLEGIAKRFRQAAQAQVVLQHQVRRGVQQLQNGGWEGRGSAAFYAEMDGTVFPAMHRLIGALEQAESVTLQMGQIMRVAEEEAARPFREGSADDAMVLNAGQAFVANTEGFSGLGAVGGGLTGFGGGLGFATIFQNKPDVAGNARLGFKPPQGRWQRSFHLDGPHGRITYPHFNAEIGPLKALNHQRIPSWMHQIGRSSVLKGISKVTVVAGLAVDAYTITTAPPDQRGGAIGGVAGGWGVALGGAAIGSAICPGVGTVIGGLIGGIAGGLGGEWAGHRLFDPES